MRASGMLLPVASLPSRYGIGAFSKSAYDFIDSLKASGQKYWQILPLGPTGYGDSPYQSFSTFAGNPYFIDLDALIEDGLLTAEECEEYDFGSDKKSINYLKIYESRFLVLRKAYDRSDAKTDEAFALFCRENAYWLEDYSLYMAVKNRFGGKSWSEWAEDIRLRKPNAVEWYYREAADEIKFYSYLQFIFIKQWMKLKNYANKKGIKIIGDIPIYVAFDSADSWANPQLFQFDENRQPVAVAGCPPDGFSVTGQLWGNPLYDWDYHKKTSYDWWIQRISYCFKLYDVVRVDHFRGFDEYYSIPFGMPTAEHGEWKKGPGYDIFKELGGRMGQLDIIAEDLGYLTDGVRALVKETGYPGMKILQFAFDSREESDYLPHNYDKNCIVYTGTHDNDTVKGWYDSISKEDKELSIQYINNAGTNADEIHWDFIRLALASVAKLAIIPVQDYLGLGKEARINVPSVLGGNWNWRLQEDDISEELIDKIHRLVKIYGRI